MSFKNTVILVVCVVLVVCLVACTQREYVQMQFNTSGTKQKCLVFAANQSVQAINVPKTTQINTHWTTQDKPDLRMDLQIHTVEEQTHVILGATWVNVKKNHFYRTRQSQNHIVTASYKFVESLNKACDVRLRFDHCAQFSAIQSDMCQLVENHPKHREYQQKKR